MISARSPGLGTALVQVPAVWVMAGITVVLFGISPRFSYGGWIAFGAVVFILILGSLLQFGQWFLDLSPFTHVPSLPAGPMQVLPVLVLIGVAAAATAIGLRGFQRRDIG